MNEQGFEVLVRDLLKEYRRYRRGRWIFRICLILLIVGVAAFPLVEEIEDEIGPHTAVVDLYGVIGIGADASAERVNEGLQDAFDGRNVKGVILRINSPGGSPVQSRQINQEIDRLQQLHPDIPVYAVVEDICASGGYYVAVAVDRIFADPGSLVGSIGVRLDSFGFVDAMQKLGVERRLFTAGENKGVLDPFLPLKNSDQKYIDQMLESVHNQFVDAVKQGRGDRLKGDPEEIFSGLFWTGEHALERGLIDDYGSVDSVARDIIGVERVVNYTLGYDLFEELMRDFGVMVNQWMHRLWSSGGVQLRT